MLYVALEGDVLPELLGLPQVGALLEPHLRRAAGAAVSARGVAGGYTVMQHDRVLAVAAWLNSTRALWRARALAACGTRGASGA